MSFSRWSDKCDIYSYYGMDDEYVMHVKSNEHRDKTYTFSDVKDMIEKIAQLQVEGYKVPGYLIGMLREEIEG